MQRRGSRWGAERKTNNTKGNKFSHLCTAANITTPLEVATILSSPTLKSKKLQGSRETT